MRVNDLCTFIYKRHEIFVARQEGKPKPWTDDEILQRYRCCNVYRELVTVTRWIADEWRTPNCGDPDLWFAMAVARWVNWPDTLNEIGYPVPWDPDNFIENIYNRRDRGLKIWTGAYMIGTQGNAKDKPLFIAENVLQPLWDNREKLRPKRGMTLEEFARPIINTKNQGTFMVGQIVADIKYTGHLLSAPDWWTWTVSGPGSRRGLNRVIGRDIDRGWNDKDFSAAMEPLREAVNLELPPWMEQLHAQDLQNCLCEFDKYERVRLGQGRPRSLYPGR